MIVITLWFLVPLLDCYGCYIFVVFGIIIHQFSVISFKLVQAKSQQLEITTIAFNAIIDSSAAQFNLVVATEKL